MANNNIQNFINSCDDMIKGKFIMADNKISKILESIANNEKLYKLVNDCVNGYNFQKEYEKAYKECENGLFETSKEIKKNVAFLICLFVEVDQHRIKFYDFINKFFKSAGAGNEYEAFVKNMLIPFKEGIISQYNLISFAEVDMDENKKNAKEHLRKRAVENSEYKHIGNTNNSSNTSLVYVKGTHYFYVKNKFVLKWNFG